MLKEEKEFIRKGKIIHRNERNGAPLLVFPLNGAAKLFPYRGRLKHFLRIICKSTKAHKQWRSARRLIALGLKTPRPVGVEVFKFGGEYEAAYLYEFLHDAKPFSLHVSGNESKPLLNQLARELAVMAKAGALFMDFHLENVLVDSKGDLWWIDPELIESRSAVRNKFWTRMERMHHKCDVGVLSSEQWEYFVSRLQEYIGHPLGECITKH